MKKKVLVTGGAGFIGSHLCKLLNTKYKVTVIDNFSQSKKHNLDKSIEILKKDICNFDSCITACKNKDIVFHLAAKVSVRNSIKTFDDDAKNNIMGTTNILKAAAETSVKKIIYASSMAVYGSSKKNMPFKETSLVQPLSPYGISKLTAEKYILLMAPKMGIDPVILRLFNVFGVGQTYTPYVGVITIFINNILKNKISTIFGNGMQQRDFVHVEDVAKSFLLAAESKKAVNNIFNIGTGKSISVKKLFEIIKEKMRRGNYRYLAKKDVELNYSCANISKAKRLISFKPKNTLKDKINEVVDYIKQNR